MTIKVELNEKQVASKVERVCRKVQEFLDAQVLKDSNYYVPLQSSTLQKSGELKTKIGSGLVVWETPYAKKQYYGVYYDHSHQDNPNACAMWFEAAKSRRLKVWEKLANDKYRQLDK